VARTLILNISAEAQTLPAAYGSYAVSVGHGRVVSDESSLVVAAMGGFEVMHGKWAVSAISTDEALGDVDVAAGGVALLASFISGGNGGGGPTYWADILSKPSFANVATSGAYADITGKPALADVATSGLYGDLSGTPTLPSASNTAATSVSATAAAGVLSTYARGDHQHAHGNLSGGALHSAATSAAAGFMSAADKSKLDGLASVATSGVYSDLSGTPSFPASALSGSYNDLTDKPTLFSGAYADLSGKPSLFSGAYADLSGTPSLFSGDYADLSGKPTKTYDIASFASGSLSVGATTMKLYAPKALSLTALNQGGGATVKVQVDGADITYPKSVTAGQVITTVVTGAGTDNYFTISAVEA
jgi:hypothetical protein